MPACPVPLDPERDAEAISRWELDSEYSRLEGSGPAYPPTAAEAIARWELDSECSRLEGSGPAYPPTAAGLRRRGVDVETAQEARLVSVPDELHLAHAVQQGRVIFTQDTNLLRMHAGSPWHCGIV